MHFGQITYNVDERAEVGLLTRNILVEGIMGDKCDESQIDEMPNEYTTEEYKTSFCDRFPFDSWGGHIRVGEQ